MQAYFVKATYTNNVYKLSDFFLNNAYLLNSGKMLNINLRPDDGLTSFITKHLVLPDGTTIREQTHVLVPEFEAESQGKESSKIYRITSIDYMNEGQYLVTLDEDPLIGNYLELKDEDIILNRSNDPDNFKGINDIADLTLKESVTTKMISPTIKSGKWALLFFQYNPDDSVIGLKFDNTVYGQHIYETTLANLRTNYPEVVTSEPELYEYYQQTAYVVSGSGTVYQCVYRNDTGALLWVEFQTVTDAIFYFDVTTVLQPAKISKTDVFTLCIALPLETCLWDTTFDKWYLSYQQFIGPVDTSLIDIKIVNDLLLKTESYGETLVGDLLKKHLVFEGQSSLDAPCYSDTGLTVLLDRRILSFLSVEYDIDISASFHATNDDPKEAEPFFKYDLYVYGKKFNIPYYLSNDIHLLIAINSGVVNYLIYYNDKRNIIASGSFTHSIRWQIDGLDSFYSQNPTYKDQFFTKMATDSLKTIAGGAIAGSVVPGLGTLGGAAVGVVGAGVDAGLSMINLNFQEKNLRMKPDQVFGENSEVSLQVLNIFGVYWVKRTSENIELMLTEYGLRGFPTSIVTTIATLAYELSIFGASKIVYGEIKEVIRNEYTTAFINQKLKQGVIFKA